MQLLLREIWLVGARHGLQRETTSSGLIEPACSEVAPTFGRIVVIGEPSAIKQSMTDLVLAVLAIDDSGPRFAFLRSVRCDRMGCGLV